MPTVHLERKLRVPADLAAGALDGILQSIAHQRGHWRGFALHVGLGELRLPDVGYIAVPIDLQANKAQQHDAFDIRFSAQHFPAAFPVFTGSLVLEAGELGESSLRLRGSYELPMQLFGLLVDKALIPTLAAKSLENFIDEMAAACQARVDRREEEYARYRFYSHSQR